MDRTLTQGERLAFLRREVEKEGGTWNAPTTAATLFLIEDTLACQIDDQAKQIAALEKRIEGMQVRVDHSAKHALVFLGEFQPAMSYSAGSLVRHKQALFTALRDINPGKAEPDRHGSGWQLVV